MNKTTVAHIMDESAAKDDRIAELEAKLAEREWQPIENGYEVDKSYEVAVKWEGRLGLLIDHMYFSSVQDQWCLVATSGVPDYIFEIKYTRDMPVPPKPESENK